MEVLGKYTEELMLQDMWRLKNPEKFQFKWKRSAPTIAFARLDYFLISSGLIGNVEDIQIMPCFRSDHSPVILDLKLGEIERGPGNWKINN